MANQDSERSYQLDLGKLKKRRKILEDSKRDDSKGYTMEGLRLGTLLKQLQALQAIEGLQELAPKDRGKKSRYEFSENQEERGRQRQWLTFKADWLQALLEDTVSELEALNKYEGVELDKP